MADNKDFLSQFSSEGKPAKKPESFQEEVRVAVKKPKKEIKPIQIIIPAAIIAVVAAILIYIFVFPHIVVEDFTGKTQTDVAKWATQYNIDKSGIIFNEEYSLDYDEGIIISQEPASGKVTKNAKMTFVISKGPDSDEKIELPDLENMNKTEINEWIDENHLLNTKITLVYDDAVPEGNVVKVDYTNIDKDNFTRGTSLKITVSKGEQPATQVTVKDCTKKAYSELETWAKTNNVVLEKVEVFSDSVESGYIVSQSPSSGRIAQGKTITVNVSKGKGVKVPDFTVMNETEYNKWVTENKGFTVGFSLSVYDDTTDAFITSQSVKAGTMIGTTDSVWLTKNLGNGWYIKDAYGSELVGGSYDAFKAWADNTAGEIGLSVDTHKEYVNSDKPKGTILEVTEIRNGNSTYSTIQRLPLEVDIYCKVSNGSNTENYSYYTDYTITAADATKYGSSGGVTYADIETWVSGHSATVTKISGDAKSENSEDKYYIEKCVSNDDTTYEPTFSGGNVIKGNSTIYVKKVS